MDLGNAMGRCLLGLESLHLQPQVLKSPLACMLKLWVLVLSCWEELPWEGQPLAIDQISWRSPYIRF